MHDEHKIQTIHDNFQLLTYYNIYPVGHPKAPTREQTTKLKENKAKSKYDYASMFGSSTFS